MFGRLFIFVVGGLVSCNVYAHQLPVGTASKSTGKNSVLVSAGAPGVANNPALIGAGAANQPYVELGFASVNYLYEHPDYDPVHVNVGSPMLTAGYTGRITNKLSWGLVTFPTANDEVLINGLPKRIGSEVVMLDITKRRRELQTGAGVSYKIVPGMDVGMSLMHVYEQNQSTGRILGSASELYKTEVSGSFFRPVVGGSIAPNRWLSSGLTIKPKMERRYQGTQTVSARDSSEPQLAGFDPTSISTGVAVRVRGFFNETELERLQWSEGRGVVADGLTEERLQADLRDTTNWSTKFGYQHPKIGKISVSYAKLESPWGEGHAPTGSGETYGADIGVLDVMDQDVYSTGYQVSDVSLVGKKSNLSVATYYANGEREISQAGYSQGFYKLSVFIFSGSVEMEF